MSKFVIQKETGLGETTVVEIDSPDLRAHSLEIDFAYTRLDERLAQTNQKIVEVREFMSQIKDPNYRYLFVTFFDQMMGISSQAEPLARKFKVEAPLGFDEWLAKKERLLEPVKK